MIVQILLNPQNKKGLCICKDIQVDFAMFDHKGLALVGRIATHDITHVQRKLNRFIFVGGISFDLEIIVRAGYRTVPDKLRVSFKLRNKKESSTNLNTQYSHSIRSSRKWWSQLLVTATSQTISKARPCKGGWDHSIY